jgi:glycine/D-amino acid oxidase-like deaminating enzyme/nitrite reductase/ring-hydroxylating ferredoxin subunit
MKSDSGKSVSVWMDTAQMSPLEPLAHDEEGDVCVIGAGIAGLTTAYHLMKRGLNVIVLDDGLAGGGETCRTTAHLASAIDDRYVEVERLRGEEMTRLAAQSLTAAIDRIEAIVRGEKIDCDFRRLDGYLFCAPKEPAEILEAERDAARRAGLTDVEMIEHSPLGFETGPCLRFPSQGQFHVLNYLNGLITSIRRAGGRIYPNTHAEAGFEGGGAVKLETTAGPAVFAGSVVCCTNAPLAHFKTIDASQAPYRTFAIGCEAPAGSVPEALYWDTEEPYHYVRLQPGESGTDILIVGGEDHKTGQADDGEQRIERLAAWTRERFPMIRSILYRWSGQVMETMDGLGFIGRKSEDEPNIYVATGDSGMGMTNGTIAGMLITDLIMGKENAWAQLYDPHRSRLHGLKTLVQENANAARQYGDWVTGGEVGDVDDIKPGDGAILRRGMHKVAAYRDEAGQLHELSATCPHLKCMVRWNSFEKTWDCPCHGSRFTPLGQVINAPTAHNLSPIQQEES